MFRKHKIASRVPLFFRKRNWSPARFSPIFFPIHPNTIFVKIVYVCVRMLKVRYSSHFVDLLFFGNITIIFLSKSSVIFPVVYMLLVKQYKIFILVINQLDAQNFFFTISLFHASTCFEHQLLIVRRSKLYYTASGICIKLVNY